MSDSCHEWLPNLTNLHNVYHNYWQEMKGPNERTYATGKAKSDLIKSMFRNRYIFCKQKNNNSDNFSIRSIELADWPSVWKPTPKRLMSPSPKSQVMFASAFS